MGKTVGLSVVGGLYDVDGLVGGDVVNDGSVDGLVDGLGVSLAPVLGEPVPVVSLTEGDDVPPDDDEDEGDVQPATVTDARMATVPQPMTVSRTLGAAPVMVVRTFIEPPHAPVRRRFRARPRHHKPVSEDKRAATRSLPRPAEGKSSKVPTTIT